MKSFNVLNVLDTLNELIKQNYVVNQSCVNQFEIDFANNLFEIINKFVYNINENIENGELEDLADSESIESANDGQEKVSEYEASPQKVTILTTSTCRN